MASGWKNVLFGGRGTGGRLGDLGLAVLRLTTGLLIAFGHGYSKLFEGGHFGPSGGFIEGVGKLGFPAPTAFAWASALTEFLGGLLIAAGLLTRPAALALAINMFVAAFLQHAKNPWYGPMPSKEMALLFLAPSILLLLTGAGRISADHLIGGSGGGSKSSRGSSD